MQGLAKDKADYVSRESIYAVYVVSKKERRENKESVTH